MARHLWDNNLAQLHDALGAVILVCLEVLARLDGGHLLLAVLTFSKRRYSIKRDELCKI